MCEYNLSCWQLTAARICAFFASLWQRRIFGGQGEAAAPNIVGSVRQLPPFFQSPLLQLFREIKSIIKTNFLDFQKFENVCNNRVNRERVTFHGGHHLAPLCFYSSQEQINQTLAVERESHFA